MKTLFCALLFFFGSVRAQDLTAFNGQRSKIDQRLMLTLGSWSTLNLIGSGIGWATSDFGEMKHFHQMNVMWNTVNLGLAVPGYLKARKKNNVLSLGQTINEQFRTEKIFLFNTALDLTYMTAGVLLRNEAKYNPSKSDRFNGFGNSLIVQGGFLFLFDLAAYTIHVRHRKKELNPNIEGLTISSTGMGLRLTIP